MAEANSPAEESRTVSVAFIMSCKVRNMLVPVSPSGAGKTLRTLTDSMLLSNSRVATVNIARRSSPSSRDLA